MPQPLIISKGDMPQVVEDQSTVKKTNYARFFWPILRGIALIVALSAFIADLLGFLYWGKWGTALVVVFFLASFAMMATAPPRQSLGDLILFILTYPGLGSLRNKTAIEGKGGEKARQQRLPDWSLVIYCVIVGLGCNWACAFLWFSRRYAPFSGPVVGATGLIVASYAAIALVVGLLTGGNWRTALLVFLFAPGTLSGLVGLDLLRLRGF